LVAFGGHHRRVFAEGRQPEILDLF
jgi:hypothetical protein